MNPPEYFLVCDKCQKNTMTSQSKDCREKRQFLYCIHEYMKVKLKTTHKYKNNISSNNIDENSKKSNLQMCNGANVDN